MNARFTRTLMAFAVSSCFVAFTAVAQTDSQQQRDEHRGGQQQHQGQNGTYSGQQQQQNRPQEQQNRQQQPQTTQHQYQPQQQQTQQNGQYRGQEQQRHDNGQYRGQEQQRHENGEYRGQQQTHENGQYRGQEQNHENGQYRGEQHGRENGQYRGEERRDQHSNMGQQQYREGNRPERWGRPPDNRPTFNFRSNDRNNLRRYYANRFGSIDRAHRPAFRMGGYLPYEDLGFLSPVPPGAWGALPPIPYGYQAGYWDGYVIIYDPNTGYILYVSDLM